MAGRIHEMINRLLARGKNDDMLTKVIRTKLVLKGIDPAKYTEDSPDDAVLLAKLEKMVRHLCPEGELHEPLYSKICKTRCR